MQQGQQQQQQQQDSTMDGITTNGQQPQQQEQSNVNGSGALGQQRQQQQQATPSTFTIIQHPFPEQQRGVFQQFYTFEQPRRTMFVIDHVQRPLRLPNNAIPLIDYIRLCYGSCSVEDLQVGKT